MAVKRGSPMMMPSAQAPFSEVGLLASVHSSKGAEMVRGLQIHWR